MCSFFILFFCFFCIQIVILAEVYVALQHMVENEIAADRIALFIYLLFQSNFLICALIW